MTEPAVYRLARRCGHFERLSGELLDRLCTVTGKPPGELLERVPEKRRGRG